MKAVLIESFGDLDNLVIKDTVEPVMGEEEVLISLSYAGVNPVDGKIAKGFFKEQMPHQFPIIMGWDGAGEVIEVGKSVKQFKPGDKVHAYFRKAEVRWGTYCERATCLAKNVAIIPQNLSLQEAAVIPLSALTAWQALFDIAHLKAGDTVLIHAGAGGVGGYAIQLAKNAGAKVYTTASAANHSYVTKLGADVVLDYTKESVNQRIKQENPEGVDVVFDTLGGTAFKEAFEQVKPGGHIVSILSHPDPTLSKNRDVHVSYLLVQPNGEQLAKIDQLIAQGKLVPPHVEVVPLDNVIDAMKKLEEGHVRGKIALKI